MVCQDGRWPLRQVRRAQRVVSSAIRPISSSFDLSAMRIDLPPSVSATRIGALDNLFSLLASRMLMTHSFDGLIRMVRDEGASSLARGLGPNVSRAIIMNTSQLATCVLFVRYHATGNDCRIATTRSRICCWIPACSTKACRCTSQLAS